LRLAPGMRVLEVGCGAGGYTRMMAAGLQGKGEWIGVDHDDALLEQARHDVTLDLPVRFEKAGAIDLPFPDGSFDAVVSAFLLCVLVLMALPALGGGVQFPSQAYAEARSPDGRWRVVWKAAGDSQSDSAHVLLLKGSATSVELRRFDRASD